MFTNSSSIKWGNRCSYLFCAAVLSVVSMFVPATFAQSESTVVEIEQGEFNKHSSDDVSSADLSGSEYQDTEYQDTEFGELLYNEASLSTRLEVLRLLSKDTPSMSVFLQAISMGLGVEDVLTAAIKYEPNKGRDFAQSAISILPIVADSTHDAYVKYGLDDLKRGDESKPYVVQEVIDRFFHDRAVLAPFPDWFEGQFHFRASAQELKRLSQKNISDKWYRAKSTEEDANRPVFVSLYESNLKVLVDGQQRIDEALRSQGSDATLPVVFIYNRLNEFAVDHLSDYPKTLKGIQQAYSEKSIMTTPAPEWQLGEYHMLADVDEFYEIFDIPEEQDFEPENWKRLLEEAEAYKVNNTVFLLVLLPAEEQLSREQTINGQQYAAFDDPRSERDFPFVPVNDDAITLQSIIAKGMILNRPDLIAVLNASGVTQVPVVFYYINDARTKPFSLSLHTLKALATGAVVSPGTFSGQGGFSPLPPPSSLEPPICASPPCAQ